MGARGNTRGTRQVLTGHARRFQRVSKQTNKQTNKQPTHREARKQTNEWGGRCASPRARLRRRVLAVAHEDVQPMHARRLGRVRRGVRPLRRHDQPHARDAGGAEQLRLEVPEARRVARPARTGRGGVRAASRTGGGAPQRGAGDRGRAWSAPNGCTMHAGATRRERRAASAPGDGGRACRAWRSRSARASWPGPSAAPCPRRSSTAGRTGRAGRPPAAAPRYASRRGADYHVSTRKYPL
jgi:hypothetical protein